MREIEFRGKSKLTGLFLDGNLLIDQDGETYIVWFNCHKKECWTSVYPDTIGQFTGIKDINGVKIYEGDILKCLGSDGDDYLSVVRYDEGAFTIDVQSCDYDYTAIGWAFNGDLDDVEVVGNIHDNPELLKGGEQ